MPVIASLGLVEVLSTLKKKNRITPRYDCRVDGLADFQKTKSKGMRSNNLKIVNRKTES
jgi:hypothetical protein